MSIQSISNASASMQAMVGTQTARSQADSSSAVGRGVETRSENIQQNTSAQEQAQRVPSAGELQKALEEVEKAVAPMAQSLQFSLDKDSGKTVVKVMDTDTNEVIRQIPTEEVLAISKAVDRLKGLLIKQQA